MVPNYDEKFISDLFDRMGPTYDVVNLISSFGFSEIWRAQCVANLQIPQNAVVADLMAGSGECWRFLNRRIKPAGKIISVDISPVMCQRQQKSAGKCGANVSIHCESALSSTLEDSSVDFAISAFGLKTFNRDQTQKLALEIFRVLRPGGSCSFTEISVPDARLLKIVYNFYIGKLIPWIGKVLLGDIECYKMLGVYTGAFGSCERIVKLFEEAGFTAKVRSHFFGCATSLILHKSA